MPNRLILCLDCGRSQLSSIHQGSPFGHAGLDRERHPFRAEGEISAAVHPLLPAGHSLTAYEAAPRDPARRLADAELVKQVSAIVASVRGPLSPPCYDTLTADEAIELLRGLISAAGV